MADSVLASGRATAVEPVPVNTPELRLVADGALIIRSLLRSFGLSDHLARRPELVDGKRQYASAKTFLKRADAMLLSRKESSNVG